MVNSTSMSSDRSIPDLWDVFGGRGLGVRRNSWQKMQMQISEEERAVTELFNDLHLHADLPADNNSPAKHKNSSNSSSQKNRTDEYNERNRHNNDWQHIEKHLSMKKTIRKKMMRDLQQAFIDGQDPADGGAVNNQQWEHNVQLDAHKAGVEPSLLDMLKDNNKNGEPNKEAPPVKKPGFWKKLTMRKSSSSKR